MMKKLLFILICMTSLTACSTGFDDDNQFNNMECPVRVLAINPPVINLNIGSIVLIDHNNKIKTFRCNNILGASLLKTYHVKDTVVNCK